jgi:Fe-S-cluster containining protein
MQPFKLRGQRIISIRAHASSEASSTPSEVQADFSLMPFIQMVKDKRFHCTMCGKCCTGSGEVWVTSEEVERISQHLGLSSPAAFLGTYTKQYNRIPGHHLLKNKQDEVTSCIFLADNKCTIHEVRPSQCRTYPWWPELMDEVGWEREKKEVCEGFDHQEANKLEGESLLAAASQLREATAAEALKQIARGKRT